MESFTIVELASVGLLAALGIRLLDYLLDKISGPVVTISPPALLLEAFQKRATSLDQVRSRYAEKEAHFEQKQRELSHLLAEYKSFVRSFLTTHQAATLDTDSFTSSCQKLLDRHHVLLSQSPLSLEQLLTEIEQEEPGFIARLFAELVNAKQHRETPGKHRREDKPE